MFHGPAVTTNRSRIRQVCSLAQSLYLTNSKWRVCFNNILPYITDLLYTFGSANTVSYTEWVIMWVNDGVSCQILNFQYLSCQILKIQHLACQILKIQHLACQILKIQDLAGQILKIQHSTCQILKIQHLACQILKIQDLAGEVSFWHVVLHVVILVREYTVLFWIFRHG